MNQHDFMDIYINIRNGGYFRNIF